MSIFLGVLENETLTKQLNENFDKIAPIIFIYERDTNFSRSVSHAIKNFYFINKTIDYSQQKAFADVSIYFYK